MVWWCSGPGHIPSFQLCPAEDTTALLARCILQGESEEKANFPFQGSAGSSVEGDSYLFIPPAGSDANEPFISRLTYEAGRKKNNKKKMLAAGF